MNLPLISYVLKASIRDRLILSLIIFFIVGVSLSFFIGSSALTEPDGAVLTFIAGSARFIGVISLVLFVVFHIRRSYDTRDVEYLLSRPISRVSYVVSHLLALSVLSIIFVIVISSGVVIFAYKFLNFEGLLIWSASLALEFMIVSYAAFFFSMVLSSAVVSAMITLAGYALARMSGQVLNIIDAGSEIALFGTLGKIMEAASIVVPRFDLFSQSAWLIYGPDTTISLGFIIAHGVAFMLLILCASIFDLQRKEF